MPTTYLSHRLNENTPQYGGESMIKFEQRTSIQKGDSSNTKLLNFPNHVGTHIDFPNHFSDEGKNLNDYEADFWIFNKPYLLDYAAADEELIELNGIVESIHEDTDLLLIRTGYQKHRGEKKYWNNNPGLAPSLAEALRKRLKNLRAVGFDFISLTSYQHRMAGRVSHRKFLVEQDIVIIEDMDLASAKPNIREVIALPLMIDKIDGGPITVIAKYK